MGVHTIRITPPPRSPQPTRFNFDAPPSTTFNHLQPPSTTFNTLQPQRPTFGTDAHELQLQQQRLLQQQPCRTLWQAEVHHDCSHGMQRLQRYPLRRIRLLLLLLLVLLVLLLRVVLLLLLLPLPLLGTK